MFDYNDLGIKGGDDLAQALKLETSKDSFEMHMEAMISRWGIKNTVSMLGEALFDSDYGLLRKEE